MTREEAKILLPIIQAYAEGKTIQVADTTDQCGMWEDVVDLKINTDFEEYRIKPEQKYRPFKDREECWQEMLKHQPFGWVIKKCEKKILITEVLTFGINLHRQESPYGFEEANRILTFADGTPFGVKVEE